MLPASGQLAPEPVPSIGVLDSGVGGLSVLREIHRLLPDCPTLYYADQAHLPYGPRDPREIRSFVEDITRYLLSHGAAMIVIACNAASAASLHDLRAKFPNIPIVGMEPAVKPAAEATRSGVIGVLTTQATARGVLYARVVEKYAADIQVITHVAPELVQIVEAHSQDTPASRAIIQRYVEPMLTAGADQIALACTHFPFLMDTLREIVGTEVGLIDPGPAIARQVARVCPSSVQPHPNANVYFTSGAPDPFRLMLKQLIGVEEGSR